MRHPVVLSLFAKAGLLCVASAIFCKEMMRGPEMAHCAHHSDAIHEFWLRLSFSIISGVTKERVKTVLG